MEISPNKKKQKKILLMIYAEFCHLSQECNILLKQHSATGSSCVAKVFSFSLKFNGTIKCLATNSLLLSLKFICCCEKHEKQIIALMNMFEDPSYFARMLRTQAISCFMIFVAYLYLVFNC